MGAVWLPADEEPQLTPWRVTARERVFTAPPWFSVWQETVMLPDGREVTDYYRIEKPDFVVVFALSATHEVLCQWHYKHGARGVYLGLPAGQIESGEIPLAAAQRELLEETGCVAGSWEPLGSFIMDGNRGYGQGHVYLARNVATVTAPDPGDLEELQLQFLSQDAVARHLQTGVVATASSALGIALGLRALSGQNPPTPRG